MTVHEALQVIVENKEEPSLNYAIRYAYYGLGLEDGDDLKTQCVYVLENMTHWVGELASEVRETLVGYATIDVERR